MNSKKNTFIVETSIVVLLILIASAIRDINSGNLLIQAILAVITFSVYVFLIASWGVSIQRRIMHRRVRHYLLGIAVFIMLFAFIRMVKFQLFYDRDDIARFLWYCYYIPQLFCALFSYRAAKSITMDEKEKISIKNKLLTLIPTLFLIFLVLTNDLHKFVFAGDNYSYSYGYCIVVAWILFLAVISINLVRNYSRKIGLNKHRKYVYIVLVLGLMWCILYAIDSNTWGYVEYLVIFSSIVIAIWETMIQIGMIPSNSAYEWCYENSSIRAQILDRDGNTVYKSSKADYAIDKAFFEENKEKEKVLINADTEIEISKLRGGYVFWERDISQINHLLDELAETKEEIVYASETLRNNITIAARKHSLREKNRLYDLIIKHTDLQIALIEKYLELCQITENADDFARLIRTINVFGSYVKRKSNIVLVSNEEDAKLGQELQLAYREIMDNIAKTGVNATYMFRGNTEPTIDICLVLMDFLENVVEIVLPLIDEITVIVAGNDGNATQNISFTFKENVVFAKEFFEKSFDMWKQLLEDNYLGSFNMEVDDREYVLCMSISAGKEDA